MKYYVYAYLNPEKTGNFQFLNHFFEFEPFYVGKGCGNRCYSHLFTINQKRNKTNPFYSKLKSLKLPPIIKILDFFNTEKEAFNYETKLISEIGSNYITDIKNGPLKNMCLIAQPPNHKGKTYQQIYGNQAEEQKRKRREKQLAVGGYFKGCHHTDETKKEIGIKSKNFHTGRKRSVITKERISKAKQGKHVGSNNPNSKSFKLISPDNKTYFIEGNFKSFCINHYLSHSTLQKTLKTNKKVKSGKTKGWQAFYL